MKKRETIGRSREKKQDIVRIVLANSGHIGCSITSTKEVTFLSPYLCFSLVEQTLQIFKLDCSPKKSALFVGVDLSAVWSFKNDIPILLGSRRMCLDRLLLPILPAHNTPTHFIQSLPSLVTWYIWMIYCLEHIVTLQPDLDKITISQLKAAPAQFNSISSIGGDDGNYTLIWQ